MCCKVWPLAWARPRHRRAERQRSRAGNDVALAVRAAEHIAVPARARLLRWRRLAVGRAWWMRRAWRGRGAAHVHRIRHGIGLWVGHGHHHRRWWLHGCPGSGLRSFRLGLGLARCLAACQLGLQALLGLFVLPLLGGLFFRAQGGHDHGAVLPGSAGAIGVGDLTCARIGAALHLGVGRAQHGQGQKQQGGRVWHGRAKKVVAMAGTVRQPGPAWQVLHGVCCVPWLCALLKREFLPLTACGFQTVFCLKSNPGKRKKL